MMNDGNVASEQDQWLQNLVEESTEGLCPRCRGREFIKLEDGTAVSCTCKKDRMLESYYEDASIPRAYFHMTLESH